MRFNSAILLHIALYLFVAEIETKRGSLDTARRHVTIAKALLESNPNVWLEGLAVVCGLPPLPWRGSTAADAAAVTALQVSTISGHARTQLAALIELAHVRLRLGKVDNTSTLLRRALSQTTISLRCRNVHPGWIVSTGSRARRRGAERGVYRWHLRLRVSRSLLSETLELSDTCQSTLQKNDPEGALVRSDEGLALAGKIGDAALKMRCDS